MTEARYHVVFYGQLRPGFQDEKVKQNLREILKLSDKNITGLLSSSRVVVKRDIDLILARKYEQKLYLSGLLVKLEKVEVKPSAVFTIDDPHQESSEAPKENNQELREDEVAEKMIEKTTQDKLDGLSLLPIDEPQSVKGSTESSAPEASLNYQNSPVSHGNNHSQASVLSPNNSNTKFTNETASRTEGDEQSPEIMKFTFSGDGGEYFKIWIVNVVLTILTLGIYSAWAKVRNKQYFYGNTTLDDASFEYTAKPLTILKGRLVAFLAVSIYYLISMFLPDQYQFHFIAVVAVIFIALFPWVVVKGLQFNARYSVYRNVNFTFDGTYTEALKAFILWPLAGIVVFLLPYSWHRQAKFFVAGSGYGTEKFEFDAGVGDYYGIFKILACLFVGLLIVAIIPFVNIVLIPIMYFLIFAYYEAHSTNLMYNNATLQSHSFDCEYDTKSFAILVFTNTLGIVLTLGLFTPWAHVRSARYKSERVSFIAGEELNTFTASESEKINSLAEGLADTHSMFDIDVGI